MNKILAVTGAALLALSMLSACGIKGDLELPNDTDEQVKPY